MSSGIYNKLPLSVEDGIPIFVEDDSYSQNYEEIADSHISHLNSDGKNPYIDGEDWEMMEASTEGLIKTYSKPGERLLDVGVGLARLLSRFLDRETYGIDISLNYLRKSANKGIVVARANTEDLPYKDDTFDCLLSTDVFEHVKNLHSCVIECLRVVKPGGVLIIRVPCEENLTPYLADDYPFQFAHLRTFSQAGLHLMFTRIFDAEVIEFLPSYLFYDIKLKLPIGDRGRYVINRLLRWMFMGNTKLRQAVLEKCYKPIEMNVVVRKPKQP